MNFHTAQEFQNAIRAASQSLQLREVFIEKDYWVTYILWNLSQSEYNNKVVFKGGTALSKAHRIINRFSEDVDLAVVTQDTNGNQLNGNKVKNLIKKIEATITLPPLTYDAKHPQESKGSKFRKTAYAYPQMIKGDFGQASNKLILEINSFANPYPFTGTQIQSYLADFLSQNNQEYIAKHNLGPFEINVLDPTRTFCEKIMGLVRASYQSNHNLDQLREKIRHIYDLSKLMEQETIQNLVNDFSKFRSLITEVRDDDKKNQEFQGDWSSQKLSEALVFKNPKEIIKRLETTFKSEFSSLLFENEVLPDLNTLVGHLKQVSEKLLLIDQNIQQI